MAHFIIAPTKGSTSFTPLAVSYERTTKEGQIPIINFLLGSQYNARVDGEMSIDSTGLIANDSVSISSGKLNITGRSTDGNLVEKIASFNTFMAFFPSTRIIGHMEIQDAAIAGPPLQRLRYEFEDLATTDKIIIDLETGVSNAILKLIEVVNGTSTTLATQILPTNKKEILFELDFLVDGLTSFYYNEPNEQRTRIYQGTLNANIFEAKVSARLMLNQTTAKTVKSDFIWILYPNVFIGYDIPNLLTKTVGGVRAFDTMGSDDEADWVEVFSTAHKFTGLRVVENGLIRIKFLTDPAMEVFGWNGTNWASVGKVKPIDSQGINATTLHDVIFERFIDGQAIITAKYGIVDHTIDIKRGAPSVRIITNTKKFSVLTSKQRFALSVNNPDTEILDFNQKTSDDTNRGNPLNLSPPKNPFIFTNDNNASTGLLRIDDNWFSWYDITSSDTVGFVGVTKLPVGLQVKAVSPTQLERIDWTFDINAVLCVGVLTGSTASTVNGIPLVFSVGTLDTYVKWRANEGIFGYSMREGLRRKR